MTELQKLGKAYYLDKDMNCAEATLMAANEYYGLGLDENALHTMAGFGAGIGCEHLCGAVTGAVAAISAKFVDGRAHNTPGLTDKCAAFLQEFRETYGSELCKDLRQIKEDKGMPQCFWTASCSLELLEKYMEDAPAAQGK